MPKWLPAQNAAMRKAPLLLRIQWSQQPMHQMHGPLLPNWWKLQRTFAKKNKNSLLQAFLFGQFM
jgi:hypothetical protein